MNHIQCALLLSLTYLKNDSQRLEKKWHFCVTESERPGEFSPTKMAKLGLHHILNKAFVVPVLHRFAFSAFKNRMRSLFLT